MAKDPAFLFYSQDFIVGVQTMTFEDRGKYISLLALMHQQGRMKEETIRYLVGSISENLKNKFQIDDKGFWFNQRLEEESEKRKNFTKSRRNNGIKGGRHKTNKINNQIISNKPKNNHMGSHMVSHMGNENEDEKESYNEKENDNEIKIVSKEKIEFEKVRKLYPGTKRGLDTEFENYNKHKDWESVLPILYGSLEYQIDQKSKSSGFVPSWANFQTWINQRRWEEEINICLTNINKNEKLRSFEQETIESIKNPR